MKLAFAETGYVNKIHAAAAKTAGAELRAIAPDWRARVANYTAFMHQEMKAYLKNSALQIIGYRVVRETMRRAR